MRGRRYDSDNEAFFKKKRWWRIRETLLVIATGITHVYKNIMLTMLVMRD